MGVTVTVWSPWSSVPWVCVLPAHGSLHKSRPVQAAGACSLARAQSDDAVDGGQSEAAGRLARRLAG